jgi:hypothetical protein
VFPSVGTRILFLSANSTSSFQDQNADRYGSEQKALFLDVECGFVLEQPVQNNKTASELDRTVAFVQGHRYVSSSVLRDNPTTTSALEEE